MGELKMGPGKIEALQTEIYMQSDLITKVEVSYFNNRNVIYINHKPSDRKHSSYYHCVHVSRDGLMVNSNGHHHLDVHNAMNKAVKVARNYLDI